MRSQSWNKSVFNTKWFFAVLSFVALCAACGDDDDDGAGGSGGSGDETDAGATNGGADGGEEAAEQVYPVPDWAVEDPAKHGFDPDILQQTADWVGTENSNCFVIVRDGVIVGEWYWNGWNEDSTGEVFSATKSFASALVGIAQKRGELDIGESASKYISEWVGTDSEAVTIKNLLSNDSGRYWDFDMDMVQLDKSADKTQFAIDLPEIDQPQQYEPGEQWVYNNNAIQTLERVLKNATGADVIDYAREHLLQPLGMNAELARDQSGNPLVIMGLQASCRDLARFGYLYLNEGTWADSEQIVPAQWVHESLEPSTGLNSAYGYLWWLNKEGHYVNFPPDRNEGDGFLLPGLGDDVFMAFGINAQIIAGIPSEGIVLARIGNDPNSGATFNWAVINNALAALEGASQTPFFPEASNSEFTTVMDELSSTDACLQFHEEHIQPLVDTYIEACTSCGCENCLTEINACLVEPGCVDIIFCAEENACSGAYCYSTDTCKAEIDGVPEGLVGTAAANALAWGDCINAACSDECAPEQ